MKSEMMFTIFLSLLGVLAGACLAIQAPYNARLAMGIGHPVAAAAISFIAGGIALTIVSVILLKISGQHLQWGNAAWPFYVIGGCLGGLYVAIVIYLVPNIGTTAAMGLAIAGQLVGGLILDKIGFLGVAMREISLGRISGVILLIMGAILVQKF